MYSILYSMVFYTADPIISTTISLYSLLIFAAFDSRSHSYCFPFPFAPLLLKKFNSYFFLQIQLLASQSHYNSNFQSFLFQFNLITSLSIFRHFPFFLHPSYTFSDLACSIQRACIRTFAYYSFSMIN